VFITQNKKVEAKRINELHKTFFWGVMKHWLK